MYMDSINEDSFYDLVETLLENNNDEFMVYNLITLLSLAEINHSIALCMEHTYVEFGTQGLFNLVEDHMGDMLFPLKYILECLS